MGEHVTSQVILPLETLSAEYTFMSPLTTVYQLVLCQSTGAPEDLTANLAGLGIAMAWVARWWSPLPPRWHIGSTVIVDP